MYQGDATGSPCGEDDGECGSGAAGWACASGAPACARSRATRSDQRTSVAPPRSGNGTSIVSKSRDGLRRCEHRARLVAELAAGVAAGDVRERKQPHLGVARELQPPGARCCAASGAHARRPLAGTSPRARARRPGARRSPAPRTARCRRRARPCAPPWSSPSPARVARRRRSRRAAAGRSRGPGSRRAPAPAAGRGARAAPPPRARSRTPRLCGARESPRSDSRRAAPSLRARARRCRSPYGRRPKTTRISPISCFSPTGPYTASGSLALAQGEGLQHARQPQPVVGVEVRDEDAVEIRQPDRAQQLALRAFPAVEQQAIAAAADEHRRQAAARARHRAGGTGEEQGEVHAGYGSGGAPTLAVRRVLTGCR